ncbi:MAG: DUF3291 domain-containing protein [Actinomycetota bacterium]|nr:DUF3291 domain-containing protein [Actinomycetota bacterium]
MEFHVAQLNVARLRAPLDSTQLSEFVANLEPINALADATPGFVWRLQTEAGDATSIRAFDDDMIIVNLSVWESLEKLRAFVYASAHKTYLGRKAEWFEPANEAYLAVWWIPPGTVPTVQEALGRLHDLRTNGPTERAFTLKTTFPEPSGVDAG